MLNRNSGAIAMAINIEESRQVATTLTFAIDTGEPVFYEMGDPTTPEDRTSSTQTEQKNVSIIDGRDEDSPFRLDTNGFELLKGDADLGDLRDTHLRESYYPQMEALAVAHMGARRAHVFDHTIRHGDSDFRKAHGLREPAKLVHNDYTERSAPQRVRDFFPDEAEDLLSRRFAIVQIWRPIKPVASDPFAIADAQSIDPADFIPIIRKSPGRDGEIAHVKYNASQRFVYFSNMTPNEALLFKVFDSATDGRARFTAHTAFELPDNSAPARESIELRLFVFF